jgi:hypothetical protein
MGWEIDFIPCHITKFLILATIQLNYSLSIKEENELKLTYQCYTLRLVNTNVLSPYQCYAYLLQILASQCRVIVAALLHYCPNLEKRYHGVSSI